MSQAASRETRRTDRTGGFVLGLRDSSSGKRTKRTYQDMGDLRSVVSARSGDLRSVVSARSGDLRRTLGDLRSVVSARSGDLRRTL